jgi:hypothetical protein
MGSCLASNLDGQAQLYASLVHLRHHHLSDHELEILQQTILACQDGDLGAPRLHQPGQLDADVSAADDRFLLRPRAAMTWAPRLKPVFGIDIEICPADWEVRYAAKENINSARTSRRRKLTFKIGVSTRLRGDPAAGRCWQVRLPSLCD